ncbi:hypothetical protein [Enterovibrio norvegicus]|uniref:hypothetical protein n=1 Tax=Enterovibrio norvegicus TaxID=188144 RepID=UPI000C84CB00|nr:hypothetical protein [Enterovibrio norvegicus]PML82149.1 hypothetical protein BCT69_02070 [Enterovibrio norvegicus]
MRKLLSMLSLAAATFSFSTFAALGNHPVVLVHGLQPGQLASQPNADGVRADGEAYWEEFWLTRADERIDWPSQERIAGKISSDYIWPKLKQLSQNNTCANGCIFVTHSTGDLVTRYILDNQENWLLNEGLQPLNIISTFDFAGAGGGSELADLAVNVAEGGGVLNATLRLALSLWMGEIPNSENTGVLNDLKVSNARQIAPFPDARVPRVRFVGDDSEYFGVTSPFLPGHDDGVVSAHSACGASATGSFSSCSRSVAFDGKVANQSRGVSSFMPQHYPMLMGDGYGHGELIGNSHQGKVTAADSAISLGNGQTVSVNTSDSWSWWNWATFRYVDGSQNATMSELVSDLL